MEMIQPSSTVQNRPGSAGATGAGAAGAAGAARADAARTFAVEAARLAANTRSHDVVVLDVRDVSPVTDYFVLATGTSARQMRTVVDEIGELGQRGGFAPLSTAGYETDSWILVDCVDVVVHVFSQDARQFYDLDGLWGDAQRVDWQQGMTGATSGR
jgi:ribosome-associated protein